MYQLKKTMTKYQNLIDLEPLYSGPLMNESEYNKAIEVSAPFLLDK